MSKPLFLIGEAKGANETRLQTQGFVGAAGIQLLRMLNEARVISLTSEDTSHINSFYRDGNPEHLEVVWGLHPELYRTNVFQLHPDGNKLDTLCGPRALGIPGYGAISSGKYPLARYQSELERLYDELLRVDPNLVLPLGNAALWALTGSGGIGKLRGTTLLSTHGVSGYKLLPCYHPSAILQQWELRPTTVIDFMKARREREFPEIRRPKREVWIEPGVVDIRRFIDEQCGRSTIVSVDIETSGRAIESIGLSPRADLAIYIPFIDRDRTGGSYWPSAVDEREAWENIGRLLSDPSVFKVFQNGLYDIAFIWRTMGIPVRGALHDTMLLHHALQPESLKGLGYLGSIYTDEGAWKKLRKSETIKRDD